MHAATICLLLPHSLPPPSCLPCNRATTQPQRQRRLPAEEERKLPVVQRVYRSLKLWQLLADLEESLGTPESTRAVYDRIMELRIATPQIILNYALFLQVRCAGLPCAGLHVLPSVL